MISMASNFTIPKHYGWVKIHIHNTSRDTLNVRVTQDTVTGTEKMATFKVLPGEVAVRKSKLPWSTGMHYIAVSTSTGQNMSGKLSVKLATSNTKLD